MPDFPSIRKSLVTLKPTGESNYALSVPKYHYFSEAIILEIVDRAGKYKWVGKASSSDVKKVIVEGTTYFYVLVKVTQINPIPFGDVARTTDTDGDLVIVDVTVTNDDDGDGDTTGDPSSQPPITEPVVVGG